MNIDLPVFALDEQPTDKESKLLLFSRTTGKTPLPVPIKDINKQTAIEANRDHFIAIGYQEIGALKDDLLLQASKGSKKSNYGDSWKTELNFTIINTMGGTERGDNITNAITANGVVTDCLVMDVANGLVHKLTALTIESGVKIQGSKDNELPFKCTLDSFLTPMRTYNIVGGELPSQ